MATPQELLGQLEQAADTAEVLAQDDAEYESILEDLQALQSNVQQLMSEEAEPA